jgi:GNAT superfamily N-acetyltransferase
MQGDAVRDHIPTLARLRIEVFREFPYLYDGDMVYEEKYLRTYIESPDSVIVIAYAGDEIIGAATAIPLRDETEECKRPFLECGYDPQSIFYFGESVLKSQYRGQGIGVAFMNAREAHASRIGTFEYYAFCAVDRPYDHPRRPKDYIPLDNFWRNRGFHIHPELHTTFTWKDLDESTPSPKKMIFWMKKVNHNSK